MKRIALIIPVLAVTALVSAACVKVEGVSRSDGEHTTEVEVTGAGTVQKLTYSMPGDKKPTDARNVRLPWNWSKNGHAAGTIKVTLTPTQQGAACKITVDGKTVVTKQGAANTELTCTTDVKD